jgi:hypothetical protein
MKVGLSRLEMMLLTGTTYFDRHWSSYFLEPGFGQRTWSAPFAITPQTAKACSCGRIPTLKAGGPIAPESTRPQFA